jgi:three-Cys-motif partner protein
LLIGGSAQKFGGPWTLLKTEIVAGYLRFFVRALKKQSFQLTYIDAFAGSGAFRYVPVESEVAALFPSESAEHPGSAQRALKLEPAFDQVIFIEKHARNVAALRDLIDKSQHKSATVEQGDANHALRALCDPASWHRRRGVIFLDPFGMEVAWETLELIAATRALDLWYLFPLAGTARCLPRNAAKLDQSKRSAMTRVLDSGEWYDAFYRPVESHSHDLWGNIPEPTVRRDTGLEEIEAFVAERLRTIFADVAPPKRLVGFGGRQLFSLFFAISNPSPSAVTLARKGADHILKKV